MLCHSRWDDLFPSFVMGSREDASRAWTNLEPVGIVLVLTTANALAALIISSHLTRDRSRRICRAIATPLAIISLSTAATAWVMSA